MNAAFFDAVRASLFGGKLSTAQVSGMNAIFAAWSAHGDKDVRKLAYILATAFHEVGGRMTPVREGFASTNAGAVAAVTKLYKAGKISTNYALPDKATGQSYYGRGLVQLTWKANYEKAGKALGVDLVNKPDLALDPEISARILVKGMMEGWFTGRKLSVYIGGDSYDFTSARRVVNGTDRAALIAGYADKFLTALRAAEKAKGAQAASSGPSTPPDVEPSSDAPQSGFWARLLAALARVFLTKGN